MPQFTVIGKKRVYRVKAKSVQALTKAMRAVGIVWQAVYEDRPEQQRSPRRRAAQ